MLITTSIRVKKAEKTKSLLDNCNDSVHVIGNFVQFLIILKLIILWYYDHHAECAPDRKH